MGSNVIKLDDYRAKKASQNVSDQWTHKDGTPLSEESKEFLRWMFSPENNQAINWDQLKDITPPKSRSYDTVQGQVLEEMTELGATFQNVFTVGDDQFIFTSNVPARRDEREEDRFPIHPLWDHLL